MMTSQTAALSLRAMGHNAEILIKGVAAFSDYSHAEG